MINVVTVLATKPGSIETGVCDHRTFTPKHARELQEAFDRHLTVEHRFLCLTDVHPSYFPSGIHVLPLTRDWGGWWAKLELFDWVWADPMLYCDLDNVITGNVDLLAGPWDGFVGARDWDYPIFNSSLMAFHGDYRWIFDKFAADPEGHAAQHMQIPTLGDQSFIEAALVERGVPISYWQRLLPQGYLGSRWELARLQSDNPPRAILWHGYPKPWQLPEPEKSLLYGEKL